MDHAANGVAGCFRNVLDLVDHGHIAANHAVNGIGLHVNVPAKFNSVTSNW
jgi:hypothetical protein